MSYTKNEIVVNSAEGKMLSIAGGSYRIVISGEQTNGEFAIIEMTVPPGAGPPPHAHEHMDESFYVLEGEVFFQTENGSYLAPKGTLVNIPKGGLIHHFKNKTTQAAKLLCTVIPAGLDRNFMEVADFFAANPEASDLEKKEFMLALAEKYGNKFYPPDYFDK